MDALQTYIAQMPAERQAAFQKLIDVIQTNIPKGFEFAMSYAMPSFVVPHEIYPAGYHVDKKQALPFVSIASQKNHIAVYHFGLYATPDLLKWFTSAYAEQVKTKLDMGKSCIRFAKPEQIPFTLLGELMTKIDVPTWIATYEAGIKKP